MHNCLNLREFLHLETVAAKPTALAQLTFSRVRCAAKDDRYSVVPTSRTEKARVERRFSRFSIGNLIMGNLIVSNVAWDGTIEEPVSNLSSGEESIFEDFEG